MNLFLCNQIYNVLSALSIIEAHGIKNAVIITKEDVIFSDAYFKAGHGHHVINLPAKNIRNNLLSGRLEDINILEALEQEICIRITQEVRAIYIYQDADMLSRAIINLKKKDRRITWIGVEESHVIYRNWFDFNKTWVGINGGWLKNILGDAIDRIIFRRRYRSRFLRPCESSIFSKYVMHSQYSDSMRGYFKGRQHDHVLISVEPAKTMLVQDYGFLQDHARLDAVVLFGSPLSEGGFLSISDEQELLADVFNDLKIYKSIYIKPHPRESPSKYREFEAEGVSVCHEKYPSQIYALLGIRLSNVASIMTSYLPPSDNIITYFHKLEKINPYLGVASRSFRERIS